MGNTGHIKIYYRYKDKLYKSLKEIDRSTNEATYFIKKESFNTYTAILNRCIR